MVQEIYKSFFDSDIFTSDVSGPGAIKHWSKPRNFQKIQCMWLKKCTVGKSLSNGIKEGMAMQKKELRDGTSAVLSCQSGSIAGAKAGPVSYISPVEKQRSSVRRQRLTSKHRNKNNTEHRIGISTSAQVKWLGNKDNRWMSVLTLEKMIGQFDRR